MVNYPTIIYNLKICGFCTLLCVCYCVVSILLVSTWETYHAM